MSVTGLGTRTGQTCIMLCSDFLPLELDFQELLLHRVAAGFCYPGDGTLGTGWKQDLVFVDQAVLENGTPDVTTRDMIADLVVSGLEVPFPLTIQRIYPNTTGDIDRPRLCRDLSQGSLDTVIDRFHQTGAKLDRKGLACSEDGVTDSQTRCN